MSSGGGIKDRTLCVLCRIHVDAGKGIRTECGHWTHSECWRKLEKPKDFDSCPQCLGYVNASDTVLPDVEPNTDDGVDYVMNPPTKTSLSMLRSAASNMLSVLTRNKRVDTENPFYLLSQGPYEMPIDSIIRDHHIGLQHMIKAGVTIDDFLDSGYSIDDLLLFKDIGERGEKRAQQALYALKMTADHLREYSDSLLPIDTLREKLGITPEKICNVYHLGCPPGGYVLCSPASEDWTARDVLNLGFSMEDLLNHAKMEYQEQYFALEPTTEDELSLNVDPSHASRLRSLEAELEEMRIQQEAEMKPYIEEEEDVQILPTPSCMVQRASSSNPTHYIHPARVRVPVSVIHDDDEDDPYKKRTKHGLKPRRGYTQY